MPISSPEPAISMILSWAVDNLSAELSHLPTNSWKTFKGSPENVNIYLVRLVNLVSNAKLGNMTADHLLEVALDYKLKEMMNGALNIKWCDKQEIDDSSKFEILEGFLHSVDHFGSPEIDR